MTRTDRIKAALCAEAERWRDRLDGERSPASLRLTVRFIKGGFDIITDLRSYSDHCYNQAGLPEQVTSRPEESL